MKKYLRHSTTYKCIVGLILPVLLIRKIKVDEYCDDLKESGICSQRKLSWLGSVGNDLKALECVFLLAWYSEGSDKDARRKEAQCEDSTHTILIGRI